MPKATKNSRGKPKPRNEDVGTKFNLDAVDAKILELKLSFVAIKNTEIAAELGISRESVSKRVNKPAFKKALAEYTAAPLEQLQKAQSKALRALVKLATNASNESVRARAGIAIVYREPKFVSTTPAGSGSITGKYRGIRRDKD